MHYIRFYYISGYVEEIAKILQKENIEYTIGGDPKLRPTMIFHIHDNTDTFKEIERLLPPKCPPDYRSSDDKIYTVIEGYDSFFSEDERLNSAWLRVGGIDDRIRLDWVSQCKKDCLFGATKLGFPRYRHRYTDGPVVLDTLPKLKNSTFFCSTNYDCNVLYCTQKAKNMLENTDLKGIRFEAVFLKNKERIIPDLYCTQFEEIEGSKVFVPLEEFVSYQCEFCGTNILQPNSGKWKLGIKKEYIPKNLDFFRSEAMFAQPGYYPPSSAQKWSFVSQKAYRFLKDNGMIKHLFFIPICEV